MKGISFNVTLGRDQMDEIASMTADKVLKSRGNQYDTEEWLNKEIKDLKRTLAHREKMIVEREIHIERYKEVLKLYKKDSEELKKYKETYGELNS